MKQRCIWRDCPRLGVKRKYCNPHYQKLVRCGSLRTDPYVNAAEVRAHLIQQLQRGRSVAAISELSGVSVRALFNIRDQRYSRARSSTAAAILAIPLPPSRIGTIRRVQALMYAGFSCTDIAERAGLSDSTLSNALYCQSSISECIAEPVRQLFDSTPAHAQGRSSRVAIHARKQNWAPIAAWIGVDIDDPDAQPDFGDDSDGGIDEVMVEKIMAGELKVDTQHNKRNKAAKEEAIRRFGPRVSAEWIARRVGCTDRTVWRVRAAYAGVTMPIHPITPWEDLVPIAKTIARQLGPSLTRRLLAARLRAIGHGCGDDRLTRLMGILRADASKEAA